MESQSILNKDIWFDFEVYHIEVEKGTYEKRVLLKESYHMCQHGKTSNSLSCQSLMVQSYPDYNRSTPL